MRNFWKQWNDVIGIGSVGLGLLVLSSFVNERLAAHCDRIGVYALVAALVIWLLRMRYRDES